MEKNQISRMEVQELQNQKEKQVYENARWNSWFARKRKHQFHPQKRFNHSAVIYNQNLFIFGGAKFSQQKTNAKEGVYKLQLETYSWENIKNQQQSPDNLSSHSCCVWKDQMVIFGGSNIDKICNNDLWFFNLQSYKWKKIQAKGQIPKPRESSTMTVIKENNLFLFGGINLQKLEFYKDIHLFDLVNQYWIKITTSGDNIPNIVLHSMCNFGDQIYIFGGSGITIQESFFNGFYKINASSILQKNIVEVQELKSQQSPPPRSSHGMIALQKQKIVIIGGEGYSIDDDSSADQEDEVKVNSRNDAWLYDIVKQKWIKIIPKHGELKHRSGFSCIQYNNNAYIFGGLKNYRYLYDDLMILQFDQDIKQLPPKKKICQKCEQYQKENAKKVSSLLIPQQLSQSFLESISNTIEFPFAAIGLLIDNAVNCAASTINISIIDVDQNPDVVIQQPEHKGTLSILNTIRGPEKVTRYILIQDDGKPWNNQQFVQILLKYQMTNSLQYQISDKKAKIAIQKQNLKKQFGNNIKLGSLRLGNGFLYISYFQNYIRAALFTIKKKQTGQASYICYYYIQQIQPVVNGVVNPPKFISKEGQTNKAIISKFCKNMIKPKVLEQIQQFNQLYVFGLKQVPTAQGVFYELNPYRNDLIYNNIVKIDFLQKMGYVIFDSPDISLKAYISLLYLKVESKIYLQTGKFDNKQQILNQMFLQKIDKQKNSGLLKQIEYANEYPELADCKVVQLYYNPNMQRKSNLFHSGILIYQKNRLIFRYKYRLGLIMQYKFFRNLYKRGCQNNVFQFFGFIELPDGLTSNFTKTDINNKILLQGFFSNLKLIIKDIKRKLSKPQGTYPLRIDKFRRQPKKINLKQQKQHKKEVVLTQSKGQQKKIAESCSVQNVQKSQVPQNKNTVMQSNQQNQNEDQEGSQSNEQQGNDIEPEQQQQQRPQDQQNNPEQQQPQQQQQELQQQEQQEQQQQEQQEQGQQERQPQQQSKIQEQQNKQQQNQQQKQQKQNVQQQQQQQVQKQQRIQNQEIVQEKQQQVNNEQQGDQKQQNNQEQISVKQKQPQNKQQMNVQQGRINKSANKEQFLNLDEQQQRQQLLEEVKKLYQQQLIKEVEQRQKKEIQANELRNQIILNLELSLRVQAIKQSSPQKPELKEQNLQIQKAPLQIDQNKNKDDSEQISLKDLIKKKIKHQ